MIVTLPAEIEKIVREKVGGGDCESADEVTGKSGSSVESEGKRSGSLAPRDYARV